MKKLCAPLALLVGFSLVACKSVSIAHFSPLEARSGEILLIQGHNFSAVPFENIVTLNGVPAVVLSAMPGEIRVAVPSNLSASGTVRVSVAGKTAASTATFSYVPSAAVSTFAGRGPRSHASSGDAKTVGFDLPSDIAVDNQGTLFVADANNHCIRKITQQGYVVSQAGNEQGFADGPLEQAEMNRPQGVAVDAAGNLFVADALNHRIRKITPDRALSTLAGNGTAGFADGPGNAAQFNAPARLALDADGNLFVADTLNHRIRKITPQGEVSSLAGSGTVGFADGPATTAQFNTPTGIALDKAGNLFVADAHNHRIRRVTPDGAVSTLAGNGTAGFADGPGHAAQFNAPAGIAFDTAGNLWVADALNHRIRRVTPDGAVSTLAGNGTAGFADGPGHAALFRSPAAIAVDKAGNLFVADAHNHRIRRLLVE